MIARMCHRRAPDSFVTRILSTGTMMPWRGLIMVAIIMAAAPAAEAQNRPFHTFYSADMPPGTIGAAQLMRGGPLPGYFQPVEITAPQDTHMAMALEGVFQTPQPAPLRAALLVGKPYRLKVTNIPFHVGEEVYPSVEIINRLYPPPGTEVKYPIPIELTREELEMALHGQYVVRVIYLENPHTALPVREDRQQQRYFEVGAKQDPLEVADALGRPVAILRLGSRVPELDKETGRFVFDSPPWVPLEAWVEPPVEAPPAAVPADPPPGAPSASAAPQTTRRLPAARGETR
jgi:hypothetical protein